LLAGGIVVNINPLYSPGELKHIIEDSAPDFIVTLDLCALVNKLQPCLGQMQIDHREDDVAIAPDQGAWLSASSRRARLPPCPMAHCWRMICLSTQKALNAAVPDLLHDTAVLQYTGGTTGISKAAMLSHANLSINAQQCRIWFGPAQDGVETALAVIPFFHAFALTALVNLSVMMGTTIIALPRFDVKQVMKIIARKRPTIFPAVPTIFATINNHPDLKKYDLTSVKYCVSGGAPLPVEVKQGFEKNTGCTLVEGYGLSESSPVVCANPLTGANKAGSIGKAVTGTEIALLSLEDRVTPVPKGEKGELCVKGPQVMLGYWNRADETDMSWSTAICARAMSPPSTKKAMCLSSTASRT
jgi:long-chain acyl-CoA synthetase